MSRATVYNLYVENFREATNDVIDVFTFSVTLTDDDENTLPNLEGSYSVFNVKRSYSNANTIVSVSTLTDSITVDANTGVVTLKLSDTDLSAVPSNREETDYLYDWDLIDNTGKFYRILKGTITFAGDI